MMLPGARAAHVWLLGLDDASADQLADVLSADEKLRAASFATPVLQQRYRRCRNALRRILADYLGQAPAALRFDYGRHGKPALHAAPIHFNVSHSGSQALVAVTRHPVGIDLEMLDAPGISVDELAVLACHPEERALLASLQPTLRARRFYRIWTQKEAYCKAVGMGLQRELSALRLQALPGADSARVIDEDAGGGAPGFCHGLPPIHGYEASICLPFAAASISLSPYRPGDHV
jgi:4'-phosphopantetheinyl transferase